LPAHVDHSLPNRPDLLNASNQQMSSSSSDDESDDYKDIPFGSKTLGEVSNKFCKDSYRLKRLQPKKQEDAMGKH